MAKLFGNEDGEVAIQDPNPERIARLEAGLDVDIDTALESLSEHVYAHGSLTIIHAQVSSEAYNFVDKGNYILYNEAITAITRNLGVKPMLVSQESIDILPGVALNHHLALEGFVADIWNKVKAIFTSIVNKVKEFFKAWVTKLGRAKRILQNLSEALSETDKDIQKLNHDKVPGGLASKFPVNGNISTSTINEYITNMSAVGGALVDINKKAIDFANLDIMDKNFVTSIKTLRESAASDKEAMAKNSEDKQAGAIFGEAKFGKAGAANRDIDSKNETLAAIAKGKEGGANDLEGMAKSIGSGAGGGGDADEGFQAALKEFKEFCETVEKSLKPIAGKPLTGGGTIDKITLGDNGVEFETSKSKDTPDSMTLGSRQELSKIIADTIKLITDSEKVSENYSKINDTVTKNIDEVDKIIKDIDAIKMDSLGKYKNVLATKVKQRLGLMKGFFSTYNKVNKDMFGMVLDTAFGNIEYVKLSLKYFG